MLRPSSIALLCAVALSGGSFGCSAAGDKGGDNPALDAGKDGTLTDGSTDGPNLDDVSVDTDPGDGGCAAKEFLAQQAPASALFVLDRSSSMSSGGKWSSAGLSIISAIDQDAFDTMSVGLLASPSFDVTGPSCLFGISVACGNPALPQVAVKPAGKDKSTAATGVRSEIYKWLSSNGPYGAFDATPLYEAISSAYGAVRMSAAKTKRLVIVITDGTLSCTSLSAPARKGYVDPNGCYDWEDAQNLIDLVKKAHDDPTDPVQTFIIGVPGSDVGGVPSDTNNPPYYVLQALSATAKVGSPETVDPTCDGTYKYPGSTKPTKPCHFDMSKGTLDAKTLAAAITKIRGTVLGCIYDLPVPTDGSTVDKSRVNVRIVTGGTTTDLKRRSDPKDTCATDGCWDYTTDGKVELIGKACDTAKTITDGKVSIVVGCKTLVK
jgi:hypothetical protein